MLGIVGDSGAGKTTLTRGLVRILGEAQAVHVSADHYHRYDREQRRGLGLTPLHPHCNHLDVLERDLAHLRGGEAIIKPVYDHRAGTFRPAEYVRPSPFTIVEGLLALHTARLRAAFDVRVYLDPPEEMRRRWKVQRDCSRRGYTTDEALEEIDRRQEDAARFIRPQRRHADLVISFTPSPAAGDQDHLDARIHMRPGLEHPDLSPMAGGGPGAVGLEDRGGEIVLTVPGTIDPRRSAQIEAMLWERMAFPGDLRADRLGEFTVGTELHRSESLAVTQLLVLYQLAAGREGRRRGGGASEGDELRDGLPGGADRAVQHRPGPGGRGVPEAQLPEPA